MLDALRPVRPFDNHVGVAEALLHVAEIDGRKRGDIASRVVNALRVGFVMNDRRIRLHGRLHVEHGGQNFVINLNQRRRKFRDAAAFGGNHRHAVADEPHFIFQNHAIIGRRFGSALPGVRMADRRHVFMRQHGEHAVERERVLRVDCANAGVRMRAGQQFGMQHARHLEIIGIFRRAGDEADAVHFFDRCIHHAQGVCFSHDLRPFFFSVTDRMASICFL